VGGQSTRRCRRSSTCRHFALGGAAAAIERAERSAARPGPADQRVKPPTDGHACWPTPPAARRFRLPLQRRIPAPIGPTSNSAARRGHSGSRGAEHDCLNRARGNIRCGSTVPTTPKRWCVRRVAGACLRVSRASKVDMDCGAMRCCAEVDAVLCGGDPPPTAGVAEVARAPSSSSRKESGSAMVAGTLAAAVVR
jgi:hypothetical protein